MGTLLGGRMEPVRRLPQVKCYAVSVNVRECNGTLREGMTFLRGEAVPAHLHPHI